MKLKPYHFLAFAMILSGGGCCSGPSGRVQKTQPIQTTIQHPAFPKPTPATAERVKLLVRIGRHYYKEGRLHLAEEALKIASEMDPWNQEAYYFLERVRQDIEEVDRKEMLNNDVRPLAAS
jgi:hypothetical protein